MFLFSKLPKQPKDGPRRSSARSCLLSGLLIWGIGLAKGEEPKPVDGPAVSARLAKRSVMLDVHGQAEQVLAVGERGHILRSTDHGKNWSQQASPTRRTLNAVFLLDEKTAWAVGHQSTVLRSQDGGENWGKLQILHDPETAFLDVLFVDSRKGFIVGSYGKLFSTDDGGTKWVEAVQGDDPHFYHITQVPDGALWLIGEFGTVWRSADLGQAWEPLDALYEGTFFGALPLAKRGALVFGLRGNIFRSEDGAAWEKIETATNALLHGGTQLKDGPMVLTAGAGELLLSDDSGRSFSSVSLSDKSAVPTSLWQAGDGGVLVTTDRGVFRLEPGELKKGQAK